MMKIDNYNKNLRLCIATNKIYDKKHLLRINKTKDNIFELDWDHNKKGRGAYLKNDYKVISLALDKKKLNKAFKMNIDLSIYNNLKKEVEKYYEKEKQKKKI